MDSLQKHNKWCNPIIFSYYYFLIKFSQVPLQLQRNHKHISYGLLHRVFWRFSNAYLYIPNPLNYIHSRIWSLPKHMNNEEERPNHTSDYLPTAHLESCYNSHFFHSNEQDKAWVRHFLSSNQALLNNLTIFNLTIFTYCSFTN